MKKIFPLLICVLIFFGEIKAQENVRSFYHFNKKNGLVSDHVQCIAQDETGFIWLATTDGLVKYDGYHFKYFRYDANDSLSLSCNNITYILPINDSKFLIGTYDCGLNIFDTKTEKATRILNDTNHEGKTGDNRVLSMFKDKQERIWIGLNDGSLNLFDINTQKIIPLKLTNAEGKTFTSCHGFAEHLSDENLMWIGTSSGLVLLNKNNFSFKIFKFSDDNPDASWVFKFCRYPIQTDNDNVWMASWGGGIMHYNIPKNEWKNFLINDELPINGGKNVVRGIAQKSDTELWMITGDSGFGIFDIQTKKMEFLEVDKDVSEYGTRKIKDAGRYVFLDNENNVWAGFATGLVYHPNQSIFKRYKIPQNTKTSLTNFNHPFYFLDDTKNNGTWVASYMADGLCFLDKKNNAWKVYPLPENILYPRGMIWDENHKILLLTANDFFEFDTENKVYKKIDNPDTINVKKYGGYSLIKSKNEKLYIGTTNFGVFEWDRKNNQTNHYYHEKNNEKSLPANEPVYDLHEDINGNIWVGMESGVSVLNVKEKNFISFSYKKGKLNRAFKGISNITSSGDGKVWITSNSSGVLCIDALNNYKITKGFDLSNGLLSNSIFGLNKINDTLLLIYHANGLQYFNPKNFKSNVLNSDFEFPFFTSEWGNMNIIDEKIYIGFYHSFIESNTKNLVFQKKPKAPKISNITVFDKPFSFKKISQNKNELSFNYDENFIKIFFSNFDYKNIKKIRLNYIIKGLSNDTFFTEKGINEIVLTGLASGNYDLLVWYSFPENGISSDVETWVVKIHPPWWKTWWFMSMVLMVFLASVFLIYFYRLKQSKEKSNLKRQLAEMENTALRAQMNPHFLFNSLNSVNFYIQNNEPNKASVYLKKFSKLVRMILNNSRKDTVTLEDELEALKIYLELEELRFSNHFSYKIIIAENVHLSDIIIPPLLIQPYVENAIWHGIMQNEKGGIVKINIFEKNGNYIFEIEDNGIGREKASALKSKSALVQKSHGMDITNERIRLFNTIHSQQISVEIWDLKKDDKAMGTKIRITYKP